MNQNEDWQFEGQITIDEILNPDGWSGKMSKEHSTPTEAKISESFCKRQRGSLNQMPLFLDWRTDTNGHHRAEFWLTDGAYFGAYTIASIGGLPRDERESALSQILEDRPHPKYSLSEKACRGVLRRAENWQKKLPPQLEEALLNQIASASKSEQDAGEVAKES